MTASIVDRLIRRGEPLYESARADGVFNARRPDRFPAAVLQARDDGDVVAAVRLAAERGWTVSVRSGGHSWAAWSLRDDALLVDLAEMRDLGYDPATGIATVRPALRGGLDLAPYLAERGRAFPGGHCASVGLGGYLLQGGQGWNGRSRGWACESVVAVDVVTAAGELVRADADENPDLYWAARGAGPGFPGIVTRFHLATYEQPAVMWHDTWMFRLDDGEALLAWLHELLPTLDSRVEPVVAATRLPEPGRTVLLLHTTVMADSSEQAQRLLDVFGEGPLAGRALAHTRGPTTIADENEAQTAQNPSGYRYAVDCTWTDAPAGVLAPALLDVWHDLDTEHSFSIWYGWAPPASRPDMAFSVEGNVYVATYLIYPDPADDERYRERVHTGTAAIACAGGVGVYLGDTDFTRRQDRFLSDANLARLEAIRAVRDPDGRFASYLTDDRERLNVHG